MKNYHYIAYEAEEGGYYAECAEIPGCFTQAETLGELQRNMKEAIELWLESNPAPTFTNAVGYLSVGVANA